MTEHDAVARLAADLVRLDSRSRLSNLPVADRLEAALKGFAIERLDYVDANDVPKRCLVAHRGGPGGLALSGHMDTVPATGWIEDPWGARIDDAGVLHGLGSVDMKGPVAACLVAANTLPAEVPVTLLLTTDEETTKQGARLIVETSVLAREAKLTGIIVAEPTGLVPVRGHRGTIGFTAVASGVQAHSSLGLGRNANWALIPFLAEMQTVHAMLRDDPAWHDPAYSPVFSDFNLIIDNHGTAVNVTVPVATARIKFRHSRGVDPAPIIAAVQAAADRAGVALSVERQGAPPELPATHPLIALAVAATGVAAATVPFGTDASELSVLAPCVILGPGTTQTAHTPQECVALADLANAVPLYRRLLTEGARGLA